MPPCDIIPGVTLAGAVGPERNSQDRQLLDDLAVAGTLQEIDTVRLAAERLERLQRIEQVNISGLEAGDLKMAEMRQS
jgi:hypothetical protein